MEALVNEIIELISKGKTNVAIEELRKIRSAFSYKNKSEIDTISARYRSLNDAKNGNRISFEEGERELSKISYSLLILLNSKLLNEETTHDNYLSKINKLGEKYIESKNIKNNPSRLREKNQITRKIAQILIEDPELIDRVKETENQGIISGIAYKTGIIPDIENLDLLEYISKRSTSNFSKGNTVNALGELVYSGQLRIGDGQRIKSILNSMKATSDIPLSKNIERVEAALDYLL